MKYIYIVLIMLVLGLVVWFLLTPTFFTTTNQNQATDIASDTDQVDTGMDTELDIEVEPIVVEPIRQSTIGQSAGGNDITAYHYGTGDTEIILIGGIHGGYSWNTAAVAYEAMNYLETIATDLDTIQVTVIPALNPDGLEAVFGATENINFASAHTSVASTIPGRFNANTVDLNRNFDCEWQPEGTWRNRTVSGGATAFSEPESQAIRAYVATNAPAGVVVWYSAAGGVYSSNCRTGVLPVTTEMTNLFATAAGYPAFSEYDYYEVTGDMVNWFSAQGIPGISVLLSDHQSTETAKNIAGVEAIIQYFQNN